MDYARKRDSDSGIAYNTHSNPHPMKEKEITRQEWDNLYEGDALCDRLGKVRVIIKKWGISPCFEITSDRTKDGTTVVCYGDRKRFTLKD